ncbi:MAG TPA: YfhO family protein, partial [Puia sp.]|nr:YfhO family protein [Puia sp.]
EKLEEIGEPEANAVNAANRTSYWGDQGGEIGTAGPVYLGAVVCFLFIFAVVYAKGWHKGWLIAATIFGIILAWGRHFSSINYFLFDYLPFYNKFRSPSMALVLPQLTVPLLAALGLDQLLISKDSKELNWKKFRTALLGTGVLLLLAIAFYFTAEYKGAHDAGMKENITSGALQQMARGKQPSPQMQQQANDIGNSVVKAIQNDRQSLMGTDLLRSFVFVALAALLLGLYLKNKIKPVVLLAGLLVLSTYDLLAEGRKYLSDENFGEATDVESFYLPSAADQRILADPDKNFRVFDETDQNGPFNSAHASYFHNSIGGYHPAKLGLYQDIIEKQLSKGNMSVFNMLNTKYFIQSNQASGQPQAAMNPGAFGPCWLVRSIHYVNNADEEMKALDSTNLRDTVVVQKNFESVIKFMPVPDSGASIKLVANLNDRIIYQFSAKTNQFAVFSEVYYDKGWNAYLDGNKTPYCKVDYVLRGMPVPAGEHKSEFRFEPAIFRTGAAISWIASILAYLLLLGAIWQAWTSWNKKNKAA